MLHNNHPHHHHPHQEDRAGENWVGFPDEILNKFFPEADDAEWAIENIINEGPMHKQVRNALLMKEVANLLSAVAKLTRQQPEFISGIEVEQEKHHHHHDEYVYPIQLPEEILNAVNDRKKVLLEVGAGPHEDVLRDSVLLIAMHWIQTQLGKFQNSNNDEKKSTE